MSTLLIAFDSARTLRELIMAGMPPTGRAPG